MPKLKGVDKEEVFDKVNKWVKAASPDNSQPSFHAWGWSKDSFRTLEYLGSGSTEAELQKICEAQTHWVLGVFIVYGVDDRGTVQSVRKKVVYFEHRYVKTIPTKARQYITAHRGTVQDGAQAHLEYKTLDSWDEYDRKEVVAQILKNGGAHMPDTFKLFGLTTDAKGEVTSKDDCKEDPEPEKEEEEQEEEAQEEEEEQEEAQEEEAQKEEAEEEEAPKDE